ncbi:uL30 family ribosomal protein [archaeon]|nr:uL30 family ribosomal protein [archaeon]
MIAAIRIKGLVKVNKRIGLTLDKLRLRRKYVCVVLREKPEVLGMLKKAENFIAYGKIDEKTFFELIEKRGQLIDKSKKTNKKKAAEEFLGGCYNESYSMSDGENV